MNLKTPEKYFKGTKIYLISQVIKGVLFIDFYMFLLLISEPNYLVIH